MTTVQQTRVIHGLRKALRMPEADYRDLLEVRTGKRSSTDLSEREAETLIGELKSIAGQPQRGAMPLTGPFAPKLRALWLSAWNLGIVRDPSDGALLRFVERQTGIPNTRFLINVQDARKAVEALKDWIARKGGVEWPTSAADMVAMSKLAVVRAIAAKLGVDPEADGRLAGLPPDFSRYGHAHYDRLATHLGKQLRERGAVA